MTTSSHCSHCTQAETERAFWGPKLLQGRQALQLTTFRCTGRCELRNSLLIRLCVWHARAHFLQEASLQTASASHQMQPVSRAGETLTGDPECLELAGFSTLNPSAGGA